MPPTKRARTAAASASSSSSQPAGTAAPKLTLRGGVPHHPSLVALWRDDRLTDFAICAEGVEFKAHRVALASCSGYFLNLFESGMRDAADATHALQGISPAVLKVLLAFVYEGRCETNIISLERVARRRPRAAARKSHSFRFSRTSLVFYAYFSSLRSDVFRHPVTFRRDSRG